MCVSAVVETDRQKLLGHLGLTGALVDGAGDDLSRRVEPRHEAWVIRMGPGGRLTAERMAFNPYVVRRRNLGGDMWASSLLGKNHGLIVLKGFSEWVAPEPLLHMGVVGVHDVNCAFNRVAGRLLLGNFTPSSSMLVPVLFDEGRVTDGATGRREFVIISDDPPPYLKPVGVAQAPLSLDVDSSVEWLHADGAAEQFAIEFEDVLAEGRSEMFSFSLYKSA